MEQFHGAVIDHLGTDDTRIYKEVEALGAKLKKIKEVTGSVIKAKAAMIFDWDTRWALRDMFSMSNETKNYDNTCYSIFTEFMKLGIDMDIISQDMDFSDYKVIVAPMMYIIKPGTAQKLKDFVKVGGQLLATYATGYVNENTLCWLGGFPGDGLSELFGIISEELDTLYPEDENTAVFTEEFSKEIVSMSIANSSNTSITENDNGKYICKTKIKDYAEMLRVKDAEILAVYESDYYKDTAAVTAKKYGDGNAYYVAARIDMDAMAALFRKMCINAGITLYDYPDGIEVHVRESEENKFTFYLNLTEDEKVISEINGINIINDEEIDGNLTLSAYESAIIKTDN